MVAQLTLDQKVAGSNPARPARFHAWRAALLGRLSSSLGSEAHKRICSGTRCTMCPMASHAGVIRAPMDNATSRGHTDGKSGLYARHGTTAVVEWEALVSVYPCNQSGMTKTARPTRPTVPCARPRWGARHFFAYPLGAPASSRHTCEGVCIAGGRHDGRDRLPARSRRSQRIRRTPR